MRGIHLVVREAHGSPSPPQSPSPSVKPEPEPTVEPAMLSARQVLDVAPLSPQDRVQGALGCVALFLISAVLTVAAGVVVVVVVTLCH